MNDDEKFEQDFEKTDFSNDIEKGKLVTRDHKKAISIRINNELIAKLRLAGEKRGLGYQPMARMVLMENIDKYLKSE